MKKTFKWILPILIILTLAGCKRTFQKAETYVQECGYQGSNTCEFTFVGGRFTGESYAFELSELPADLRAEIDACFPNMNDEHYEYEAGDNSRFVVYKPKIDMKTMEILSWRDTQCL